MMLSIFNNGSAAWVILVLLVAWCAVWGYRSYKSHKSGYNIQSRDGSGKYYDVPKSWKLLFTNNGNFKMLLCGIVGLLIFLFWINADYKKVSPEKAQSKWEKQKAKEAK